jgi:hypothetical protein
LRLSAEGALKSQISDLDPTQLCVIVSLPPPEVQLSLLASDGSGDGDDVSIAELMRRDVDLKLAPARTRRRRAPKPRPGNDCRVDGEAGRSVRCGLPTIGTEVRVRVHTTIAQRTRRILSEWHVTFAEILDECAREFAHAS